jgi:hypothetical protein
LKRRTIKESLSKDLSNEMIENLEYILLFYAIGNLTFSYHLFSGVTWQTWLQLVLSIIYIYLPLQELNEKILPIKSSEVDTPY